jgi:hypothetical protein
VVNLDSVGDLRVSLEFRPDQAFVTEDQEAQRPVVPVSARNTGDHGRRAAVSTHCVDRDLRVRARYHRGLDGDEKAIWQ